MTFLASRSRQEQQQQNRINPSSSSLGKNQSSSSTRVERGSSTTSALRSKIPSTLIIGRMPVVRVGVGVLVQDPKNPRNVYCGIRKGSHGAGTLALPGGHLELYESWEDCAMREVREECDLDLDSVQLGHVTNDPMPSEHKHYVTIFMLATCKDPEQRPKNMEPEKCLGWKSYSWEELVEHQTKGDLFGPLDRLVRQKPKAITDFLGMDKP